MRMHPVDVLIALVLLVWLLTSMLNQFDFKWFERIRRHDSIGLLPNWKFFARDSGQWDYRLLYRDRYYVENTGSVLTEWQEIPVTEARKLYSFLWNPQKRSVKVLSDVVSALLASDPRDGNAILLSMPYLILLNVVCQHGPARTPVQRQFIIVSSFGRRSSARPRILFRSAFHTLE